jgi:hypothetical protein
MPWQPLESHPDRVRVVAVPSEAAPPEPGPEQLDAAGRSATLHPVAPLARTFKTFVGRPAYHRGHGASLAAPRREVDMTPEQALAFVLFSVAAAGPPGPGHAMLTAVGANVGVLRGLPALLGVALGMGLMMSLRARQPDPRPPRCPAGAQVVRGRIPLLARLEDRDGGRSRRGRRRPAGRDPRRGRVSVDQPEVVARVRQRSGDLPGGGDGERRQPVGRLRARVRGGVAAPAASPGWPSGPVLQRVLRAERPRRLFNVAMGALLAASGRSSSHTRRGSDHCPARASVS